MFFAIKLTNFKMLWTLPTIWISFIDGVPHCWIPKTGFAYKFKNRAQPPNETDAHARRQWYFLECEILFKKGFDRFNDCEMALSKLNYGPEWYQDYSKSTVSIEFHQPSTSAEIQQGHDQLNQASDITAPDSNGFYEAIKEITPELNEFITPPESIELDQLNQASNMTTRDLNEFYGATVEITSELNEFITPPESIELEQLNQASDLTTPDLNGFCEATVEIAREQNESITPPANQSTNVSEPEDAPKKMSDLEEYNNNKLLCVQNDFRPPIHYKKFAKLIYNYVTTYKAHDLQPGYEFKTLDELKEVPRKLNKPFCRPGPVQRGELYDWYLADSVVQKVQLKADASPSFVVRWVGYEDKYNTVEPLANVKDTSIYKLFTCPDLYTACRSQNSFILRRSGRTVPKEVVGAAGTSCEHKTVSLPMDIDPSKYESAIKKLIADLKIEEDAGRYFPEIGFCSYKDVTSAQMAQYRFIREKFNSILNDLKSNLHLDEHYIGQMLGNLNKAIYFDPSPKCFAHKPPKVVYDLTKPGFKTFTKTFGVASEKDDCMYQCMRYIIGIATGEVSFVPDSSEPCRRLDRYMMERAAKKMKIENE